jgi:hypothetical protein
MWCSLLALLGLSATALGQATSISSITPNSAVDGSSSFTMTLSGTFLTLNNVGVCFYTGYNVGKPIVPTTFNSTTAIATIPASALTVVPSTAFSGGTFTAKVFLGSTANNCNPAAPVNTTASTKNFTINQVAFTVASPSPAQIGAPQGAFTLTLNSSAFPPFSSSSNGVCFYTGSTTSAIVPTVSGNNATLTIPASATSGIPASSYTNGIYTATIWIAPAGGACITATAESNIASFSVVDGNLTSTTPSSIYAGPQTATSIGITGSFPAFSSSTYGMCFYAAGEAAQAPLIPTVFNGTATVSVPASYLQNIPASDFANGSGIVQFFVAPATQTCNPSVMYSNTVNLVVNQYSFNLDSSNTIPAGQAGFPLQIDAGGGALPTFSSSTYGLCFFTPYGTTLPLIPTSSAGISSVNVPASYVQSIPPADFVTNYGEIAAEVFVAQAGQTCNDANTYSQIANVYLEEPSAYTFSFTALSLNNPSLSATANPTRIQAEGYAFSSNPVTQVQFTYTVGGNANPEVAGTPTYLDFSDLSTTVPPPPTGATNIDVQTCTVGGGNTYCGLYTDPSVYPLATSTGSLAGSPNTLYTTQTTTLTAQFVPGAAFSTPTNGPVGVLGGTVAFSNGSTPLGTAPLTLNTATATFNVADGAPVNSYGQPTVSQLGFFYPDFNQDGIPDAVVFDPSSSNFHLLLGTVPRGDYLEVNNLPTNGSACSGNLVGGTVGDVNGDGFPDLVYLCQITSGVNQVLVALNNGGIVTSSPTVVVNSTPATMLAIGDVNKDGSADIVLGGQIGTSPSSGAAIYGFASYLGNGTGTAFTAGPSSPTNYGTGNTLRLVDYDQDGYPDIAIFSTSTQMLPGVALLRNDHTGAFGATIATITAPSGATYVAAPLSTSTAYPSILVTDQGNQRIGVSANPGTGAFTAPALSYTSILNLQGPAVWADFSGDGNLDVATLNGGKINVRTGNGAGVFSATTFASTSAEQSQLSGATLLTALDQNADGFADILTYNSSQYSGTAGTLTNFMTTGTTTATLPGVSLPAGNNTVTATTPGTVNTLGGAPTAQISVGTPPTATITWATPAAITYGTLLSGAQLNATATNAQGQTVPGTFTYSPQAGTLLGAGSQTLSVLFTPTDMVNYSSSTKTVTLTVNKATPTVSWTTPASISYGTALSSTQLDATATGISGALPGTFTYTPAAGTVLGAGTQTLSVLFTPTDATDYTTVTKTVSLVVNKATPGVTWATPAPVTYGTALSATQLNASATGVGGATLSGTFTYTPTAGTVLGAGTQTLSVLFTPTDATDYNTATQTVSLVVNKAAPVVTWTTPSAITYGTALSATQLNATASVPGTFAYTPSAGTVLGAGTQTLSVLFTPTDATDYSTAAKTVSLVVNKATPAVSWVTPAPITYGTALSSTQLDATATGISGALPGSFTYNPAAGAILNPGSNALGVSFTPTDTTDYNNATGSTTLLVNLGSKTINFPQPTTPVTFGASATLTATASNGDPVTYSIVGGIASLSGSTVNYTRANSVTIAANSAATSTYAAAPQVTVTVQVNPATPIVTWNPNPATIPYGTALSSSQLDASANVFGTFTYTPAAGAVLNPGPQTLSASFVPSDTVDYTNATGSANITVTAPGAYTAPTTPVGTTSATQTAYVTITTAGQIGAINVLTQGATGLDYQLVSGGTCTVLTAYTAGQVCSVFYSFTPAVPGTRLGGITLTTASGGVLGSSYLNGVGTGPQVSFPGNNVPTTLSGGFTTAFGVTEDASGNIFVADVAGSVEELFAATNFTSSRPIGSGFTAPSGLAVDGFGNVFVADNGPIGSGGKVAEVQAAGGYTNVIPVGSGFSRPRGIAVDGGGNVYVSDYGLRTVEKFSPANGYTTATTLASGAAPFSPQGIAVDGSGDVFYANSGNGTVKEITAASGYATVIPVGSGFSSPFALALDGSGNLFVSDESTTSSIKEVIAAGGYTTVNTLASGFVGYGLFVDRNENVLVATYSSALSELNFGTPPTLSFPSTQVGSSSATQTVTVANDGNASLNFSAIAASNNNFAIPAGSTCSTAAPLAAGATCTLNVDFTPQSIGALNGTLNLADNSLNATAAQQSVPLSGIGLAETKTITFPQPSTPAALGSSATLTATASNGDPVTYSILSGTATLAGSTITYTTAGTVTIAANSAASGNYAAAAQVTRSVVVQQGAATVTWNTPAAIAYGTALSATQLNATASVPGTFTYTPAAGTVLGAGTQSLSVLFTPTDTTDYSAVTKTVSLLVTQATPIVNWPALAPIANGTPLSATQLDATATGIDGATLPGTFTYTPPVGTVLPFGTQTLNVSFAPTDSTDYTSATGSNSIAVMAPSGSNAPTTPVGSTSATQTVTVNFAASGTLGSINALTQGAPNLDFKLVSGGTCATGTTYTSGQTCTVLYSFTPSAPGARLGGISLADGTGAVLGTSFLTGIGTGPQIVFPSVSGPTQLFAGLASSEGLAFDGSGNIFLADYFGAVYELPVSGGYSAVNTVGSGFRAAFGIAVDGFGNLFVTDTVAGKVDEVFAAGGYATVTPIGFGVSKPAGIAVDGSGNVYVTDLALKTVRQFTAASGYTVANAIGSGFSYPAGVALDSSGNVFVADRNLKEVLEVTAASGYTTVTSIGSGFAGPTGVTLDPAGNVYVADSTAIKEILAQGGYTTVNTVAGNYDGPGMAFDSAGNLLFTNGGKTVNRLNLATPPTLAFPATVFGSSSAAQTVTVANQGNAPLVFTGLADTDSTDFPLGGSTCTATGQLAAGSSCSIGVSFTPQTASALTAGINLTDNTLNAAGSVQTIPLTGTGLAATKTITFPQPASPIARNSSVTLGATASNGDPVTYSILSGTATLSGSTITFTTAGSVTIAANSAATTTYSAAAQVTRTVQVQQSGVTITWVPNPASIAYGTALSAAQLDATASVPGTFVYTPAAGTVLGAGTQSLSVTFTPADTTDYSVTTQSVSITVNKATPTVAWANPAGITQGTALSATQLNATASVPGTFTYTPPAGTVLGAGTQTLSVLFTPTDATDYNTVTQTVSIVVGKATPTVTWANPAGIVYGTALSATQLNATASVPGIFTYTPAAGTVLLPGTQTLSVLFTPTDATDYTTATQTVALVVNNPTTSGALSSSANPSQFGQTVTLSLAVTPVASLPAAPSGSVTFFDGTKKLGSTTLTANLATLQVATLTAGTHALTAVYSGDTNYAGSTSAVLNQTVAPATTVVTWTPSVASIVYGTALSSAQLNATVATAYASTVAGVFTYTPAAGSVPTAGVQTLRVTFTPTDAADFLPVSGTATITVTQATPVLTWPTPAGLVVGSPLTSAQLDATAAGVSGAALPGTFVYTPAAGTLVTSGNQTLSVVFTPTDITDYTTASTTVTLGGTPLSLTALSSTTALLGDPAKTITLTGTGFLPSSVVQVAGAAVGTTYVSSTTLTAIVPASAFQAVATLPVTVSDPAQNQLSAAINLNVTAPPVAFQFSAPATTTPTAQPTLNLALTNPYPVVLTGTITLAFAPSGSGQNDPSIQFAGGGRTLIFQVQPNTTTTPTVQFQTGTVAGTITLTLQLMAGGVNVTPATIQPATVTLPQVVPGITSASFTQTGSSVVVSVVGYSNTLQVATANFHFTGLNGAAIANPDVQIPVAGIFNTWFGSTASPQYGSEFTYTQQFTVSDGVQIGSVSVTLANSVGTSAATTTQ